MHGASIDPDLYTRGYSEKQLEVMKQRVIPKIITSCNLEISKPLEEFSFTGFDYSFGLYDHYKSGNLPFNGPISEQPARVIEIFNLFKQLEHETQDRARKEQKANGK